MATKKNLNPVDEDEEDGEVKEVPQVYIAHGSPEHAELLGIRKATEDDEPVVDGWALVNLTEFGPNATASFLKNVLRQKVSELKAGTPVVPANSPKLWRPKGNPVTGEV